MKYSLVVIFSLLVPFQTQAQDYLISFTGTGGSTTIDSVQVINLTQNTSLTLNGIDVLHLMGVVGIDPAIAQSNADLRIYPNPMNESSFVEFEPASSGNAILELCDVAGKLVAQTQNMLPCGKHTFKVSGLSSGIYTLSIKSPDYVYSGKIVCTSSTPVNGKITYVSTHLKSADQGRLKSNQSLIPMQYNNGDQLLFKCFSGMYATVIPLVPTQSQMVIANFITCTDADNNNYATVTIGTQIWMAENLNVGIRINGVEGQTNNGIIEKYCYNNDEANCAIYGGLYQWDEMMQYVATPGVQGICPIGWHLPTYDEWTILTTFLGGTSVAGGKMKSTGTIEAGTGLWYSFNIGVTNESGFTAVQGGSRGLNGDLFSNLGAWGNWWGSSEYGNYYAWNRILGYNWSFVEIGCYYKSLGFSVRCVLDL
ncbi:MAG: FISUMP domain-containing protein [Bacteroidota bacterium]